MNKAFLLSYNKVFSTKSEQIKTTSDLINLENK